MTIEIPVITIDGPSGSGKGTISKFLAKRLGWHFLDSGAIYRALAYAILVEKISMNQLDEIVSLAKNLSLRFAMSENHETRILYKEKDITEAIRKENVGETASKIAVHQRIREALLQRQRDFKQPPGLVADGRDMGTIVFPDARLKIFLTASLQERAARRFKQLQEQNQEQLPYQEIFADLAQRDKRDVERAVAPLKPADDAHTIDTTKLTIEQVMKKIEDLFMGSISNNN